MQEARKSFVSIRASALGLGFRVFRTFGWPGPNVALLPKGFKCISFPCRDRGRLQFIKESAKSTPPQSFEAPNEKPTSHESLLDGTRFPACPSCNPDTTNIT